MVEQGPCAVCSQPAALRCSACRQVFYCGKEHQKTHWTSGHKSECRKLTNTTTPVKSDVFHIAESSELGRYLVAARDIPSGELILQEIPLVEGPSQFSPPVCLLCYNVLTHDNARPCDRCGWPICSRHECRRALSSPGHPHTAECEITSAAERRMNITVFGQHHPSYESVTALRCLSLRERDPVKWKAITALQAHSSQRAQTPRYEEDRRMVGHFVLKFLKLAEKGFSEEDVLNICGILQVNGHEVPSSDPPHVALCSIASLFEHSCIPNCARRFVPKNGSLRLDVEVRSLRAIRQGEHLSICYSDPLWGTANRRLQLQQTKFFECACERCSQPSELGSMLSAVRCLATTGCPGFMLPRRPLESASPWVCEGCNKETDAITVDDLLQRLGRELASLPQGDCEASESYVTRTSGFVLHPHHYYLTDVRLALCQMWGHRCGPAGLSAEPDHVVAAKLKVCEDLMVLADILAPGPTALRGLILMELQAARAEDSRRRLMCGDLDTVGLRAALLESRRFLIEALHILRLEAASPNDREQAEKAGQTLKELDAFLQALPRD